jgi:hypothetical protein
MRPALRLRLTFFAVSAALHAVVLGLGWGVALSPPSPLRVHLVAPPHRPGESSAPRGEITLRTGAAAKQPPRAAPAPEPAPEPARAPAPAAAAPDLPWLTRPLLALKLTPPTDPYEDGEADEAAAAGFRPVADLTGYGPGDARLTLVLRLDRIRGSPYAEDLRRVLAAFPDHRTLAVRTGLDPLADLDSILIATVDPSDVTATFLAARYRFPEARLRRLFDRQATAAGGRIRWTLSGGRPVGELPPAPGLRPDPRVLVLLRPGLAVFTQPEHVVTLTGGAAAPDGGATEASPGRASSSTEASPGRASSSTDWPARLSILEVESGAEPEGPALLLTLADVPSFAVAARGETLPVPHAARLMVTGLGGEPAAYLELTFDVPALAERFAAEWPARARAIAAHPLVFLAGLGGLWGRIEARAHESTVRARAILKPREVRRVLGFLAQLGPVRPDAAPASQPASQPTTRPASPPASGRAPGRGPGRASPAPARGAAP